MGFLVMPTSFHEAAGAGTQSFSTLLQRKDPCSFNANAVGSSPAHSGSWNGFQKRVYGRGFHPGTVRLPSTLMLAAVV